MNDKYLIVQAHSKCSKHETPGKRATIILKNRLNFITIRSNSEKESDFHKDSQLLKRM